jgi:riboflavin biosynthesis pyrimidine reductase
VRVVIDPERRLSRDARLFSDGAAPTLRVCAADRLRGDDDGASVIGLAREDGGLALRDLVDALGMRGLRVLFIEGGGITVSRWIAAGLLDRLQIAVAPLLTGEGRPALHLPPAQAMSACLRPPSRIFAMGEDVLWDFDLRGASRQPAPSHEPLSGPRRIR